MFWPVLGSVFVVVVFMVFSLTAKASVWSFFENIFGAKASDEANYNSQNVPLLQAPQTSDPGAVGGASMSFVEDSAILPVVGPLGSLADVDTYKLDQIATYAVRAGDSISGIAKMFGVSASTIYWANDLKKGQVIKTGQVLVILPISGIQYEVKKGDTIKSLATKFKSDESDIVAFNDLAGNSLTIGDTIIIPDAEVTISSVSGSAGTTARCFEPRRTSATARTPAARKPTGAGKQPKEHGRRPRRRRRDDTARGFSGVRGPTPRAGSPAGALRRRARAGSVHRVGGSHTHFAIDVAETPSGASARDGSPRADEAGQEQEEKILTRTVSLTQAPVPVAGASVCGVGCAASLARRVARSACACARDS